MLRSILALSILMLPLAANAAHSNLACSGEGMSATVTIDTVDGMETAVTQLTVNGKEIPALNSCRQSAPRNQGNIRIGKSWRCPHDADGVRYEVYPLYPRPTPPHQKAPYISVIIWKGESVSSVDLTDCE